MSTLATRYAYIDKYDGLKKEVRRDTKGWFEEA